MNWRGRRERRTEYIFILFILLHGNEKELTTKHIQVNYTLLSRKCRISTFHGAATLLREKTTRVWGSLSSWMVDVRQTWYVLVRKLEFPNLKCSQSGIHKSDLCSWVTNYHSTYCQCPVRWLSCVDIVVVCSFILSKIQN